MSTFLALALAVSLCLATAGLIIVASRRTAPAGGADPAAAVYRRQLDEIDEMAERGVLADDERKAAHAEAARRLISAGHTETQNVDGKAVRNGVIGMAAFAILAAVGLYAMVGAPGAADHPFAERTKAWRETDPNSLSPDQIAVLLKDVVANNPENPEPLALLARAQMASGQSRAAIRSAQKALSLAPTNAETWALLGQAQAEADNKISPQAERAFTESVRLDPTQPIPRYFLGLAKIERGDVPGGLTIWKALAADLPADDPRSAAIREEIANVERTGGRPAAQGARDPAIMAMVEGLAERLKEDPDDPDGWARLVRSYAVLGDQAKLNAALADARRIFASRPADLAAIEAAVSVPAPAPGGAE